MSLKPQRSIRNALLNRVRRHATISTIFRASDPVQSLSPMDHGHGTKRKSQVSDGSELVQATLVNLPPQSIDPRLSSTIPVRSRQTTTEPTLVQKKSEPIAPFDTTIDQVSETNPYERQSSDDLEMEDSTWKKLKNIFRRHQEQESQKSHINKPEGITTNPVQMESEVDDFAGERRNTSTVNSTGDQDSSSGLETLYSDTGNEPLSQTESRDNHLDERKYRKPNKIKPNPEIPTMNSLDQDDAEIADGPQSINLEEYPDNHQKGEEESEEPISSEKSNHMDPQSKQELNSEPRLHEIPLEAAWPVQKKKGQPIQKADKTSWVVQESGKSEHQEMNSNIQSDVQSDIQTVVGVKTIQRALKNVGPSQPTSSSIEIITPRRPRPRFKDQGRKTINLKTPDVQKPVSKTDKEPTHPLQDNPSPKPNQRTAGELSEEDPDLKEIPGETQPESFPLDSPSMGQSYQPQVKRVQDSGDSASEVQIGMDEVDSDPDPELVQTDIGQLPVDLWQLLNQDAPPTKKGEDIQTESGPTSINRGSQVMRQMEPPKVKTDSPESTDLVEPKILGSEVSSIQRTTSTSEHQDVPSETSTTESADETNPDDETSQSTEPDINELSMHVYAEIKHRLMVEWERKRNRNL